MKWITRFWFIFSRSASEPVYYLQILRSKFSSSLVFYLVLLLFLSIVDGAIIRLRDVPRIISALDIQTSRIVNDLPPTFTTNYSAGKLSFEGISLPLVKDNLIALTKEEKPTPEVIVTLMPTQMILQGTTDVPLNTRGFLWKEILGDTAFSLDKTALEEKRARAIATLPTMANWVVLAGIPVWFLILCLATTLTLLFLTLLTNSFAWVIGIHMPFIKTLQLGLHAIGIATTLDVIKFALFPSSQVSLVIPGFLGIMGLVLWTLRGTKLVIQRY